jgi:hypothetical protein
MTTNERIEAFSTLGTKILNRKNLDELSFLCYLEQNAYLSNSWFIPQFVGNMLDAIGKSLTKSDLIKWLSQYPDIENIDLKTVAVIMAGNIPLVGFHDFLSVLISGHKIKAKLSSDDKDLLPAIAKVLCEIEPRFAERIEFTDGFLKDFDAVIATGSNNSARYFEYYFGKYPNVIRRNRNSAVLILGNETDIELKALADDIFLYFGLGCRNVSQIYLPENYDVHDLFASFSAYEFIKFNSKYMNNYDYFKSIFLVNSELFLDNEFVMMIEKPELASRISVLHLVRYQSFDEAKMQLLAKKTDLQCVVTKAEIKGLRCVGFGQTQSPALHDYADGVDTMEFLTNL